MSAAVNIEAIKSAIRTWVINGSKLAPNHVIWTLGKRAPSGTYVHIRVRIGATIGSDAVKAKPSGDATPGHEVQFTVLGGRYGTITLTCFAPDELNDGERSPEEILNDTLTASSLPSSYDVLTAAKVGILSFSEVTPIDLTIDEVQFEPRAYVTARFHTTAQLSELGPSIDSVAIHGNTGVETSDFVVDTTP